MTLQDHTRNQTRILHIVSLFPGVHLRQLQRLVQLSFSSTRYHVESLTKNGQVARMEEGGYSRLYPADMPQTDRILFSFVRKPTDSRILDAMVKNGSVSIQDLCQFTNLAKSTVSEHLATFLRSGVVATITRDEGKTEFQLLAKDRVQAILLRNQTLVRQLTNSFIDLWDF